uniref:Serine/threonine-protein kinase PLK n=1 Tax=Strigamia maritima TaxID=126957 RepID=T1JIY9_STRMM
MASKQPSDFRPKEKELPAILIDPKTKKQYTRGRFLGKGGFAKCYELTDNVTKEVFAGKIVSKGLLMKQHQKEKMSQEITIHKSLNHKHIVGFVGFFEDNENVYIVLELCRRRSLMELHKRRYLPTRLPVSCLTMAPRYDSKVSDPSFVRKPLVDLNSKQTPKSAIAVKKNTPLAPVPEGAEMKNEVPEKEAVKVADTSDSNDCYLSELLRQLDRVVENKMLDRPLIQEDEAEDPAAVPMIWISKWVDYSDKYGLGYQLCDNSVGVVFNDSTKIVLLADGENIHYIDRATNESYYTLKHFADKLSKKVTLLKYFRTYMNEHLLKAGASMTPRDGDDLSRIPHLRTWLRTRSAIVLHLTNGTLQFNFFQDHTKIILCPLMGAVTFLDDKQNFRTLRLSLIEKYGCSRELSSRLRYARSLIRERLIKKVDVEQVADT